MITTKLDKTQVGFALYVGLTEEQAQQAGYSLAEIAASLNDHLRTLVPEARSYAAAALAPLGVRGDALAITRAALREPGAARHNLASEQSKPALGIVVDLKRRKVFADGKEIPLTCKEYELFAYLIENEGKTVSREQIGGISERCGEARPNARTIDVHVRRLRAKISGYEDVIRTQRGQGYRFDPHPDVLIESI